MKTQDLKIKEVIIKKNVYLHNGIELNLLEKMYDYLSQQIKIGIIINF